MSQVQKDARRHRYFDFSKNKNISMATQTTILLNLRVHFFFPRIKIYHKVQHFGTLENIQTSKPGKLKAISVTELHNCYEQYK